MRRGALPALLFLLAAGGTLFLGSKILDSERSSTERTARERLRARLREAEAILISASADHRAEDPEVLVAGVSDEGRLESSIEAALRKRKWLGRPWESRSFEPRGFDRLLGTRGEYRILSAGDTEGLFYLEEAERAEAVEGDPDRAAQLYEMAAAPERSQLARLAAQYRAAALERRRGNVEAAKVHEAKFLFNIVVLPGWDAQVGTLEDLVVRARAPESGGELVGPLLQAIGSPDEAFALGLLRESGRWSDEAVRARRLELDARVRLRPLASALSAMSGKERRRGWGKSGSRLVSWTEAEGSPLTVCDRPLPSLPEGVRPEGGVLPAPDANDLVEFLPVGVPPVDFRIAASVPCSEVETEARLGAWMLAGALAALLLAGGAATFLSVRAARRETEAARARADFVTKVGHDLRTPLAVVRMYAETLAAGRVADPAEAREFAGIAAREAERLTGMVGQVLDLSRVAEGDGGLARRPLDLAALAAEVAEVHRPLLHHAGIRLEVRSTGALPVLGDSASLRGAVSNLLENAGRHAATGGSVEIESARDGTMAAVRVLDRGAGLPAGMEERIFERFVRGPAAAGSGAGLGLALVREAAEAHGGTARASSREGGGAVFTVSVPLGKEEA